MRAGDIAHPAASGRVANLRTPGARDMPRTRRAARALNAGLAILMATCGVRAWADDEGDGPKAEAGNVRVEGVVSYDGPLPEPVPVAEAGTVRHLVEVEPK